MTQVSLCQYGGHEAASVTADEEPAPEFARMLEFLFGETHYAVIEGAALRFSLRSNVPSDPDRGPVPSLQPVDLT